MIPKLTQTAVCPDVSTLEGERRFYHHDLQGADDAFALWGEETAIRSRLADLAYEGNAGELLHVVQGVPIYEREWYAERLPRLQRARRRIERGAP